MSVEVDLSADEVAQIKRATEMDDEKEAVAKGGPGVFSRIQVPRVEDRFGKS